MAYKIKPNKAVAKRMGVTATGKLKVRHTLSTHLRSARTAKKKRHLGRPFVLHEGLAVNMRRLLGLAGLHPRKAAHQRKLKAKAAAKKQ
jgi:ribosomal protein L35